MFVTWLPGVGRFCLTVKYGRHSLRDGDWYLDTRAGLRSTQSPLEQARLEDLRVSETLRRLLGHSVPVAPALAFPDTERDRRMERLASRDKVPLLWDLERCTARLAEASIDSHFHQPLERAVGPGRDIGAAGVARPDRRGDIPRPGPGNPVCSGSLTVVMAWPP